MIGVTRREPVMLVVHDKGVAWESVRENTSQFRRMEGLGMAELAGDDSDQPMPVYPRWAVGLSLVMFVVGCLSATLATVVKDGGQNTIAFITGAAVFIPLGAMGLAMGYTARVQEALTNRIKALELQLLNNGSTKPGVPPDRPAI